MELGTLRIIGNGPGSAAARVTDQLTITFNPPIDRTPVRGEIQISNWKHGRLKTDRRPFVVAAPSLGSAWCCQFEDLLRHSATTLEPLLGCFPSSGLVAIHAGLQLADRVSIYRMPLKPCFVRAADMTPRKPLRCAFHNWLGERRIGLSLLREYGSERLNWESFLLADATDGEQPGDSNPLALLADVFSQGNSVRECALAETLERLSRVHRTSWIRNGDGASLKALEHYFFLSRNSSDTQNWWLFNNRISSILDDIVHKLMLCQLELLDC